MAERRKAQTLPPLKELKLSLFAYEGGSNSVPGNTGSSPVPGLWENQSLPLDASMFILCCFQCSQGHLVMEFLLCEKVNLTSEFIVEKWGFVSFCCCFEILVQ